MNTDIGTWYPSAAAHLIYSVVPWTSNTLLPTAPQSVPLIFRLLLVLLTKMLNPKFSHSADLPESPSFYLFKLTSFLQYAQFPTSHPSPAIPCPSPNICCKWCHITCHLVYNNRGKRNSLQLVHIP